MSSCKPSKLLVNAVFLVLALIFANEVINAFMRYSEGKLGISTKEMKSKYVKFPSVTICLDLDTKKENNGFKDMAPINETMRDLDFVRHYSNGQVYKCNTKVPFLPVPKCFVISGLILQWRYFLKM